MNREIKFRGKRLDNGEWVYGFYWIEETRNHNKHHIYTFEKKGSTDLIRITGNYNVDPATVGQYTGLKDKNSVEIYEGDIAEAFKHGDEEQRFELIVTHRHCFMFGNWTIIEFLNKFRMVSIIGNIHKNPDLLESGV